MIQFTSMGVNYYRSTLCVGRCRSVCLSVCLSHSCIVPKLLNIRLDLLAPSFRFLESVQCYLFLRGTPSSGALNRDRVEKFAIFGKYVHISRKLYKIGPQLLRNVNRKSQVPDRSESVPVTLNVLERRDARTQVFRWIYVPFDQQRSSSAW